MGNFFGTGIFVEEHCKKHKDIYINITNKVIKEKKTRKRIRIRIMIRDLNNLYLLFLSIIS